MTLNVLLYNLNNNWLLKHAVIDYLVFIGAGLQLAAGLHVSTQSQHHKNINNQKTKG